MIKQRGVLRVIDNWALASVRAHSLAHVCRNEFDSDSHETPSRRSSTHLRWQLNKNTSFEFELEMSTETSPDGSPPVPVVIGNGAAMVNLKIMTLTGKVTFFSVTAISSVISLLAHPLSSMFRLFQSKPL